MEKRENIFRILLILLMIHFVYIGNINSQTFNDYQKKKVAENVDNLLKNGFTRHLDLYYGSDNKPPNKAGKENFFNCFKDQNSKVIPNFAFNPDSLKSVVEPLSPLEYVELFTRMYDYGIVAEDINVYNPEKTFWFEDIPYLRNIESSDQDLSATKFFDKYEIQKDGKKYRVAVPFKIPTFTGQYKSKIITDENGVEERKTYGQFSNVEPINLLSIIFFDDPAEKGSYKIVGLETLKPYDDGCFKYLTQKSKTKLDSLINEKIVNILEFITLSDNGTNKFDNSKTDKFLKLFSDKTINTIDCKLFFTENHCQSEEPLTPKSYIKMVDSIYEGFFPLTKKGDNEITCLNIEDNNIYVEVKTNIEQPRVQEKQGQFFKLDTEQIVMNLLIPSESSINPSKSNDATFSEAYLTHVGLQSAPLQFKPKQKGGSFSYSFHYYPDFPMMPGSDEELFNEIEVTNQMSHGFGVSANYYKYSPEKPWNYGCGLGIIYRNFDVEAGLNSYFDTISDYSHNVLGTIDLYKEGKKLKQTLTYTSISIPITGNMRYDLSQKSFIDIRAGIVPCFNFSGNTTQNSGKASYQGYYELLAGDSLFGSYLIKDVPEYGFTTDQDVKISDDQSKMVFEDISFSGILGVSFSTLISTTYPIYLDFGPYLQFSLSKTFKPLEEGTAYILDDKANAGNMFQSGLDGRVNIIGFTVGLRWFDKEPGFVKKISID